MKLSIMLATILVGWIIFGIVRYRKNKKFSKEKDIALKKHLDFISIMDDESINILGIKNIVKLTLLQIKAYNDNRFYYFLNIYVSYICRHFSKNLIEEKWKTIDDVHHYLLKNGYTYEFFRNNFLENNDTPLFQITYRYWCFDLLISFSDWNKKLEKLFRDLYHLSELPSVADLKLWLKEFHTCQDIKSALPHIKIISTWIEDLRSYYSTRLSAILENEKVSVDTLSELEEILPSLPVPLTEKAYNVLWGLRDKKLKLNS